MIVIRIHVMDGLVGTRVERARAVHNVLTESGPPVSPIRLSDDNGVITLSEPSDAPSTPIDHVFRDRRSRYSYGPLGQPDLSALLRWALGPQRTVRTGDGEERALTFHPSAGGLPSTTAYVIVLQAFDEIPVGVYQFDRGHHRLLRRRTGDVRSALAEGLVQPQFARRAPVVVILVGELEVTMAKYSERHYRTVHVDAGLAAAHLYLIATALDLACCAISGFYDNRISEMLSLQRSQVPLLAFAVGSRCEVGEQRQPGDPHPPAHEG